MVVGTCLASMYVSRSIWYGLKQNGLLWNDVLVVKLVTVHGMEQCKSLRVSSDLRGQESADLDCTCGRRSGSWS